MSSSNIKYDVNDSMMYTDGTITYADNIIVRRPEADEYYTFLLTPQKADSSDTLELFDKLFNKYCKDKYDSSEINDKKRFISPDVEPNKNESYPNCFPKVSDHLKELLENKIWANEIYIDDEKVYLSVMNGNLHALNKGGTYSYLIEKGLIEKSGKRIGMFFPDIYCEVKKNYFTTSDDKVDFSDEKITISQAQKKTIEYITELVGEHEIKPCISQTTIMDMKGRTIATLYITGMYKGVPFDANEMKKIGAMGTNGYSNNKEYYNLPECAIMDSSDNFDIITGYSHNYKIRDEKKVNLKIGLKEATRIVDKTFSVNLKLIIKRIELVYCRQILTDEKDGEIIYDCYPVWKLSGKTNNSNNDLCIYVNALNGECYYYENQ